MMFKLRLLKDLQNKLQRITDLSATLAISWEAPVLADWEFEELSSWSVPYVLNPKSIAKLKPWYKKIAKG